MAANESPGTAARRRHKRYEVRDVRGSLLFRVNVTVINISLNGMRVETTERLRLARPYSMRLTNARGAGIDVEGIVRWCRLTKTRTAPGGEAAAVYEAGLTFSGILTDKAKELLSFMEQHVVLALEKRILGRFKVQADTPIDLEYRYDFEVTKLSLSGMLIRTRLLPAVDSSFDMEIRLQNGRLDLRGRVAYRDKVGGTDEDPVSELGVEFLDVSGRNGELLQDFIANELE